MKAAVIRCFSIFDTQKARKIGHKREQKTTKEIKTLHRFKNLKSLGIKPVPVQVRLAAPEKSSYIAVLRSKGLFFCHKNGRPFRDSLPFYHLFFFLFYLENKPHYPRYDLWTLNNYNFHKYYLPKCYSLYYSKIKNRLLNMTAQQANIRF